MSREQLLAEIQSSLEGLGLEIQTGNGTDISVSKEFLDAKWSAGSKRISYESCIFASEEDRTVYMYEKTTETGKGISFGSDGGSSFQSGGTLFRKVKGTKYGPDGKVCEYDLDLGAIPKAVKEAASKYGWKFKTVLGKSKALYPAGYIPSAAPSPAPQVNEPPRSESGAGFCAQCGAALGPGSRFCGKCGKPVAAAPAPAQSAPQAAAMKGETSAGQSDGPRGEKPESGERGRKLFPIGLVLLALIALFLMLVGKVSLTGWIFAAILLIVYFLIRKLLIKKGCVFNAVIFILFLFLIFVTFSLTQKTVIGGAAVKSGLTPSPQAGAQSTPKAAQTVPSAAQAAPLFRIDYLSLGLWPAFTYTSDTGNAMQLGLAGDIGFSLYLNQAALQNPADKVSKISVNVKTVKAPPYGTLRLYRMRPDLASAPSRPAEQSKYALPMSFDLSVKDNYGSTEDPKDYLISYYNSLSYGQVRIFYCVHNLMPVDPSLPSWLDSVPAASGKGMTSDTLRATIGLEILITMQSGERHRIYVEREMIKGDFFSKTRLPNVTEDYQGKTSPIVSAKVG